MEQIPGATSNEAYDARWYPRFKELFFSDYDKLEGAKEFRKSQKEDFLLADGAMNPSLDYPLLETFAFESTEEGLLTLKADILEFEPNLTVVKLYRARINELIANVRMLRAAKDGDDRRYSRYSEFIYGKPQVENIAYVAEAIRFQFSNGEYKEGSERSAAVSRILELLDCAGPLTSIAGATRDILPSGVKMPGKVLSVEHAVKIFTEAFAELGIEDWTVVVDSVSGKKGLSTSQERKEILLPSNEEFEGGKFTLKRIMGYVEHEVMTHAVRRENGERSKLRLLGLGLDRYERGEEGVATYAEQQITGAKEFAGIPRYFAIAIAKGLGGEPRDFRQTFSVLRDYYVATLKDAPDIKARANEAAWNLVVRVFRGTTCASPGAVYTKDLAYMGNRDVWTLVSKDTDVVLTFSLGKYDPTNDRHKNALAELGISSNLNITDHELDKLSADPP